MRIKWFSLVRITGLVLVLFYHYFQTVFPGGFIGVDIFFTFSGFLITSLLLDEFAKKGRIDVLAYFKRRGYRIIPPLAFMILITMPLTFLVRRDYIASIGSQIAAAFGFMTNYYEILSGGSYESQFIPHLFIHTWSLAIEVHYYILWGLGVWFLSKRVKNIGQLRGSVFLISTGLFLLSFIAMFAGTFFTDNYSYLYFSSVTHIFPFFIGSSLATLSGVQNTVHGFKRLEQNWSLRRTLLVGGVGLLVLILGTFLLKFDSRITYMVGFLVASLAAAVMIFAARVLHEKTPNVKEPAVVNFLADTSYGVYLFHWPLYIIFGQLMSNGLAALLTTFFSLIFAALSFYILEPTLANRPAKIFGAEMDMRQATKPVFWLMIPLGLVTMFLMVTAPKVGDFDQNLIINSLNQADVHMQQTRANVDNATATNYNVQTGDSLIGDSVALRASEYLQSAISGIQVDASVSRSLDTGIEVYETAISNRVLLQNVIIALGTNPSDDFKERLDQIVSDLPKGHRLIFVTPYDGRVAGDASSVSVRTRQYQQELAKKYDYIYIADWYQTALDNPAIWTGTDNVHFGSDSDTINQGGQLYANTVKTAVDEANKGPVKP